jgi:hypothetical protein
MFIAATLVLMQWITNSLNTPSKPLPLGVMSSGQVVSHLYGHRQHLISVKPVLSHVALQRKGIDAFHCADKSLT